MMRNQKCWKTVSYNWKFWPFGGRQRPLNKIRGHFPKFEADFKSFFAWGLKKCWIKNISMLIEDFVGLDHFEATSRGRFDELKKFRWKWQISRPRNSWIRIDGVCTFSPHKNLPPPQKKLVSKSKTEDFLAIFRIFGRVEKVSPKMANFAAAKFLNSHKWGLNL